MEPRWFFDGTRESAYRCAWSGGCSPRGEARRSRRPPPRRPWPGGDFRCLFSSSPVRHCDTAALSFEKKENVHKASCPSVSLDRRAWKTPVAGFFLTASFFASFESAPTSPSSSVTSFSPSVLSSRAHARARARARARAFFGFQERDTHNVLFSFCADGRGVLTAEVLDASIRVVVRPKTCARIST